MSALELNDPAVSGLVSPSFKTFLDATSITQSAVVAPATATKTQYKWYVPSANGGGLTSHHLQLFGYFDPAVAGDDSVEPFVDAYPAATTNSNSATGLVNYYGVFRTASSLPRDYTSTALTGTLGVAGVVANGSVITDVGWTANSVIKLDYCWGTTPTAAPTYVVANTNNSTTLTITCTAGSHYNYQIFHA